MPVLYRKEQKETIAFLLFIFRKIREKVLV